MKEIQLFVGVISAVLVILVMAQICGWLAKYIGQPAVVGEMIAGVLLGPTVLGFFAPVLSNILFNKETVLPSLYILSSIGLSFYMFLVGLEIDFSLLRVDLYKKVGVLTFSSMVPPFILGAISAYWLYNSDYVNFENKNVTFWVFTLFTGTALAITAFPMLARILQEKNIVNTEVGILSLMTASLQDVFDWVLLALILSIARPENHSIVLTIFGGILFVLIVFLIVKPALNRFVIPRLEKNGVLSSSDFAIIIVLILISIIVTDGIGIFSVFGGFILGLAMPRNQLIQKQLVGKLYDIMVVLFLPMFFALSGLKTNFIQIFSPKLLWVTLLMLCFAFVGKGLVCTLAMRGIGHKWKEAVAIGALINSRGLMIILIANIGLQNTLISESFFSILVLIAIVTTGAALPLYNWAMKLD